MRDDGTGFDPARIRVGGSENCVVAVAGRDGDGPMSAGTRPVHGGQRARPAANGTGPPAGGGFGLVAMRQRIEALSGTLQVESEPGAGTGISARVPIAPPEARP